MQHSMTIRAYNREVLEPSLDRSRILGQWLPMMDLAEAFSESPVRTLEIKTADLTGERSPLTLHLGLLRRDQGLAPLAGEMLPKRESALGERFIHVRWRNRVHLWDISPAVELPVICATKQSIHLMRLVGWDLQHTLRYGWLEEGRTSTNWVCPEFGGANSASEHGGEIPHAVHPLACRRELPRQSGEFSQRDQL
jgi:hypothetical protein